VLLWRLHVLSVRRVHTAIVTYMYILIAQRSFGLFRSLFQGQSMVPLCRMHRN
jgi:hypothetical protein